MVITCTCTHSIILMINSFDIQFVVLKPGQPCEQPKRHNRSVTGNHITINFCINQFMAYTQMKLVMGHKI